MGFHEVQFPTDISYGSKFGPGFKTEIVVLPSVMPSEPVPTTAVVAEVLPGGAVYALDSSLSAPANALVSVAGWS